MSEKRDLWVPALLAVAGVAISAWNFTEGRVLLGLLALLLAWAAAISCLPLRLKRGQGRVVTFGAGVALLLVPLAPGAAGSLATGLPWVVAGLALVLPMPALPQNTRAALLGGAALLAVLSLLALVGALPKGLTWLFLSGAFLLGLQVVRSKPRKKPEPPPGPRVCLMGGSFDPFHRGHRALAEAALRVVDRLLVIPAGRAPHKPDAAERTPFHHRVAMARLGVEGLSRTEVLELEGRRAGPSYTVDTLDVLRGGYPEGTRFLVLVGADMYQDLPNWKEWERIVEMATLLVARRPGYDVDEPPELEGRSVRKEPLTAPEIDVSSTELRAHIREGEDVGDLVSPAVLAYVREHRLYRAATPA